MPEKDLTEVDFTLNQIAVRDRDDDSEGIAWQVEHDELDRPVRGDTPEKALRVFANCIEADEGRDAINLEALETEDDEIIA